MKITVFQSDHGDCLLLKSGDGKNLLSDGGLKGPNGSYRRHVANTMGQMRQQNEKLDLVYVSHIDEDHISGVLQMLDDEVKWRVFDYQRSQGNTNFRKPRFPRPPEVTEIWNNSFHEQLGKNAGAIESMWAASATALAGAQDSELRTLGGRFQHLATSERQAVLLSRRIGSNQLDIPLNKEFGGRLIFVSDPTSVTQLGTMRLTVIGPFSEDLENLRDRWNKWLRSQSGKDKLRNIRRQMERDEELLRVSEIEKLFLPMELQAKVLGKRSAVSEPNLASLMLLAEEGGKSCLLTGDGHGDDVLDGLHACGKLDSNDQIFVDVLKFPHHGSEHNVDANFCKNVIADEYVFCGNGHSDNPELDVIDAVMKARVGNSSERSTHPRAGDRFRLSFNSSEQAVAPLNNHHRSEHMRKLERHVRDWQARSGGRMRFFFLKNRSSFDVQL